MRNFKNKESGNPVRAAQFTGISSIPDILGFCPCFDQINNPDSSMPEFGIPSANGPGHDKVPVGNWIIEDGSGKYHTVSNEIFNEFYVES